MSLTCSIISPETKVFDGEIKKISFPTDSGALTILPGHKPITARVSPGIVRIAPVEQPEGDFIFSDQSITLSVAGGFAFVDGRTVRLVTSTATTNPDDPQILEKMKSDLESQLQKLHAQNSLDELEKTQLSLQKIRADLELSKLSS